MDTESFFFAGVVCFLSAEAISLLHLRKVINSSYIFSGPGEISDGRDIAFMKKEILGRMVK